MSTRSESKLSKVYDCMHLHYIVVFYINKFSGLGELLKDSYKGRSILQFYETHSVLDSIRRDDLITIILEDIQYHNQILSPKDYSPILLQIKLLFPSEENSLVSLQDITFTLTNV